MVGLVHLTQFAPELDVNGEIQIPVIALVGLHRKHAVDLLVPLHRHVVVHVEDSLLPVGVGSFWSRAQSYPLVTLGEFDGKEGDQCLDVIIATDLEMEWSLEVQIFLSDCVEIHLFYQTGVGYHLLKK
ncbi:hypothetical protein J6590_018050 [Homalodisca vitripennis]|nr:hypothetical protein J6590_018050 [Homalodisca vitripennis]